MWCAAAWLLILAGRADEGAATDVFPYMVRHERLANGLDVFVVPMGTPGVVSFATWMAVGSRDEVDAGRTGFAHFFEHLMFYGTPTLSRTGREDLILRSGAEDNAWTWFDETVYHTLLAPQGLPALIAAEGDRFQSLTLTPDDVRKEAGAVYGEYRKSQANPDARLFELLYATAFETHTYRHDTIGYEADIRDMPSAHPYAAAFFSRFYRPEHADVIVVGDVDPDEVVAMVQAAYGGWTPATEPRPAIPPEPPQQGARRATLVWSAPTAPRWVTGWKVPAATEDPARLAAIEMASELLLGPGGPLDRRLVKEEGLAWSVSGGRDDFVDPGLFTVYVMARDAGDLDRIDAIVREEIAALAQVTPERLEATRTRARYGVLSSLDDPDTVAEFVGHVLRRHGSTEAISAFYTAFDAVTAPDLARVVDTVLVDAARTTVTLTPPAPENTP